jgi:hypothetical protein
MEISSNRPVSAGDVRWEGQRTATQWRLRATVSASRPLWWVVRLCCGSRTMTSAAQAFWKHLRADAIALFGQDFGDLQVVELEALEGGEISILYGKSELRGCR